ncbi:HAD-IA family hydrolase [Glaciecola sp. 2405UD65-10]|uniref:HAD-IA family hydrolase n=1 Tax=Glaciecola sp. 2405UD65-10 TaxID=3397244 RepID=UPI003B5AF93A
MITYKKLNKVKAISFDLDDTLYNNMPYITAAEKSLSAYLSAHYPLVANLQSAHWFEIKSAIVKSNPNIANDVSELRRQSLAKAFAQNGMHASEINEAVENSFSHFYSQRSNFVVPNEVKEVLEQLSKRVPITAITNGNVDCQAIGIAPYFTYILQANSEFAMKPHSSMFDHTARALNLKAANILHVGDHVDKDVKGAINAGYQAAWLAVDRRMDLKREKLSVLPHIQLDALHELLQLVS